MITEKDLTQISSHGLNQQQVNNQLENFRNGFPYLNISRAAVIGDGIVKLNPEEVAQNIKLFRELKTVRSILKFVPASGAATRMFKELFEFVEVGKESKNADEVVQKIDCFAFGSEIRKITPQDATSKEIVSAIIDKKGLGYGQAPKALILFHKYAEGPRTALEEHLAEGAAYAVDKDGSVNIHFTVSPEHQQGFESLIAKVLPKYENQYGIKYNISYSQQKSSTDTIAVTPDNEPFRESSGALLFRPAGHGALIENLNDVSSDLIFIKTVDNVAPDHLKADTVTYKEALGGMVLGLQKKCFEYLNIMDNNKIDAALLHEITNFAQNKLSQILPSDFGNISAEKKTEVLRKILDRPIRVCGMVKNEGEPGGGPFWVHQSDGSESLQIAESSQISPEQSQLMKGATHFNPVDLVCSTVNHKGQKFDLREFVDPKTGFISSKSKDGRELKAQELPGLWNGAMAAWNTIFVEVPISTFSPVKIVNDLLRAQHINN